MRIARYSIGDQIRYGTVELAEDVGQFPDSVADLSGDPVVEPVKLTGARHPLSEVRLLAPVLPRSKVIGIARSYLPAVGAEDPAPGQPPQVFLKPNTSVIGPDDPIVIPRLSQDTGLEGELAVVIGRICRQVPLERVPEVVFGYTVANDVTARDLFGPDLPWGVAKGFDDFTPLGPWIVTHLSLEEVSNLTITTTVDGQVTQHGTTKQLRRSVAELVSYLSQVMTLLPGDLVLTGTPPGACQIQPGQRLEVTIEEIGRLSNPVIAQEA
ncbi:MAG: fumarylacetoacetate hydrolase family protein [Propionibacteriaceae bacterium]|jgi:2-keto-4-pentenoate hydratase/2-oxohepta-3-ene-1,7-dioic acid hydratase in catechol pathway|nr:fumarylacetoacetate hydrolase family protein [Propionibacteriaceae bacterium]